MDRLKPYVNLINLERMRELAWCHDAIAEAMTCYRHFTGRQVTFEQMIEARITPEGCKALIYGAMTAHTPITLAEFMDLYDDTRRGEYSLAVLDGVANYWLESKPEPVWDDLDLLYPDTQKEKKPQGPFFFLPLQLELMAAGFSLADVGRLTMRNTELILQEIRGVVEADMSWLETTGVTKG